MVESVTAPLAAGIIAVVVVVMALARAAKRRAQAPESQASPKRTDRESTHVRRAS